LASQVLKLNEKVLDYAVKAALGLGV